MLALKQRCASFSSGKWKNKLCVCAVFLPAAQFPGEHWACTAQNVIYRGGERAAATLPHPRRRSAGALALSRLPINEKSRAASRSGNYLEMNHTGQTRPAGQHKAKSPPRANTCCDFSYASRTLTHLTHSIVCEMWDQPAPAFCCSHSCKGVDLWTTRVSIALLKIHARFVLMC